ncbi:hypothetical protein [Streptomyces graminilatus]|uniref:hypothetical protein n=1 Tax=Streptomyces graminilatus TaxID=1464070 RepID=UPI0006E4250E|nr:hypothetical protein [Streptomyces graminilatus]
MTTITRTTTAAAICAAVLLTATACSTDGDGDGDGPKTSAKTSASATPARTPTASASASASASAKSAAEPVESANPYANSVTKAPETGLKTIASAANGRFGQTIPLKGGLHKGTLGIALNCEGKGTVKVEVPALGMTYTDPCDAGKVTAYYNESRESTEDPDAYIQVMGTSGVRWSISVGQ